MPSSLFYQPSQANFNLNNLDLNEKCNENYENYVRNNQQLTDKDWKQMHAINYFSSNDYNNLNRFDASHQMFDNVQNKTSPCYYQQQQFQNLSHPELNFPMQSSTLVKEDKNAPRKIKKSRVLFSQWQINELEKLFKKQKYVTSNEREIVSKRLRLNPNQVKIWFQNRRYKIKKKNN